MSVRRHPLVPGQVYHVCNRGALRNTLFFESYMYDLFLEYMDRYAKKYGISIVAICLMPNHFHLLVRIEEGGDLPQFMKCLSAGYSRRVNLILHRVGTIYQGRYFAKPVKTDRYLKAAIRYIHLNPVKSGLVSAPEEWEYSDFREILGQRAQIEGEHSFVRGLFRGVNNYLQFMYDGLQSPNVGDPELGRDLAEFGLL